MKNVTFLAALVISLSACVGSSQRGGSQGFNDVVFDCERGGSSIEVRFFQDDTMAVLTRNGTQIDLSHKPAGSGFLYTNGQTSIRGKGDDLNLIIGRMAPIHCSKKRELRA